MVAAVVWARVAMVVWLGVIRVDEAAVGFEEAVEEAMPGKEVERAEVREVHRGV